MNSQSSLLSITKLNSAFGSSVSRFVTGGVMAVTASAISLGVVSPAMALGPFMDYSSPMSYEPFLGDSGDVVPSDTDDTFVVTGGDPVIVGGEVIDAGSSEVIVMDYADPQPQEVPAASMLPAVLTVAAAALGKRKLAQSENA